MSAIYDNWDRLVAAALKKQQIRELFHAHSRSPSVLSEESDINSLDDLLSDLAVISTSSRPVWNFFPPFYFKDVYLASAELLGRGNFGTTYAATGNDGVKIVVKRLKPVDISVSNFKRQMDIIGKIKLENVIPLRAYYCSEDEKLILYDYYSNGSVSTLLHGKTGESRNHVDWYTRLRIAFGTARGIAEVHAQNGGTLVHGNIKSSNIFINSNQLGAISDCGLASIFGTTSMSSEYCYAPEIRGNKQNVSQESDVYSFGILLLELLTRKSPVHIPGVSEAVDLVKLVRSVRTRLWTSSVLDVDLLQYPAIRKQMVEVLKIGINCITKFPMERPKLSYIVKMLGVLIWFRFPGSMILRQTLVFTAGGTPKFNLEDISRASSELLFSGRFWSTYKIRLETGEIFVVRKLSYVTSLEHFDQYVDIFGRSSHENVCKLTAYYHSEDERMLFYDYYQHSVSHLLHENEADDGRTLDWETRLEIAVGAARGLAHIHSWGLTHGNVGASTIFLQNGLVSDAVLAKVMAPIKQLSQQHSVYLAPEIRGGSQPWDVFHFGVLLLELASERPSQIILKDKESMIQFLILKLAKDCINDVHEQRLKMSEVVRRLEEISEKSC